MKKFLAIFAVLVLALALVACGGDATDTTLNAETDPVVDEGKEHVHNFVEEITPATCVAVGKVVSKCECGEVQSETEIPMADHTASVLDCEKDTVCTVCNTVLAEKTGHILTASEVVTPATCSAAGKDKGVCMSCGKIVESEIPATGHILSATGTVKAVDGGFAVTCASCNQEVTLKAGEKVFELTFDEDFTAEAAKYNMGLVPYNADKWATADVNGSKALSVQSGSTVAFVNIDDVSKLTDLGTFLISFDFMSTKEGGENEKGSIVSFLSNFYNGTPNYQGTTNWGWLIKLNEADNAIVTSLGSVNDTNSVAIERNKYYKIEVVVVPTEKVAHVFVDGHYIGIAADTGKQMTKLSDVKDSTATLRFGDGPLCGYTFDNFAISKLN